MGPARVGRRRMGELSLIVHQEGLLLSGLEGRPSRKPLPPRTGVGSDSATGPGRSNTSPGERTRENGSGRGRASEDRCARGHR